jgi:fluoride ion exporter CrcB/FEX
MRARSWASIPTSERAFKELLRQLLESINTLLKMPRTVECILVKLETGQFVINLGGDISIGATAFRRRASNGAETAFPIALALMFIASLGTAAFFLNDRNQLLAIDEPGLAAFLGLRLLSGGEAGVL